MSTLKVDTIQKADGSGSLSVPAESGTVVTTASPSVGRRNILINGAFQVSQRGDYSSATSIGGNSYSLDRWKSWNGGSGNAANVTHTTATIDGTLRNVYRIEATASWTGHLGVHQVIEQDSSNLNRSFPEGCTLTASVWIRSNNSYARLRNNYMISGYAGIDNTTTHTGDGQWEYHTWTIDTTGRTQYNPVIGVICYDNTNVPIVSGDYIEIADFQLEVGSVATPFEHRSYGEELALCQRYYEKTYNDGVAPGTSTLVGAKHFGALSTTNHFDSQERFNVVKRTTPTMSIYASNGVVNQIRNESAGSNLASTGFIYTSPSNTGRVVTSSSAVSTHQYAFHWVADAEL